MGNAEDDPLIDRESGRKKGTGLSKNKGAGGGHTTQGMAPASKEVVEKQAAGRVPARICGPTTLMIPTRPQTDRLPSTGSIADRFDSPNH